MIVVPTIFEAPTSATTKKSTAPVNPMPKILHQVKPLTTFCLNPEGVRFETQEAEEEVILFLRQHIIVNVPWLILAIILLLAPTFIFPFAFGIFKLQFVVPAGYIIVGTLFWYLMTFGFVLANFIGWFFNIYIVTNERVVDIDFLYLLYKQFSEAELTKIQDISYTTGGIVATVFNYGNVSIETAGEAPNLEFEKVPHPEQIVQTIRTLVEGTEGGTV